MKIRVALLAALINFAVAAQDTAHRPRGSQIPGPGEVRADGDIWKWDSRGDFAAWLADLKTWRHERLTRMGYSDSQYRRPEFQWAQRNFIQPQMMAEERYFYNPENRSYTVGRYVDDLDKRYGGIDSVLIWPVYPNIGIDNRNQWDLARDLPGGIPALRKMVEDFHRRGVHVFFPTMPWDNGTRDVGMPYWQATARLMAEIGADGVNGDTFAGLPRAYREASDATGHPVIFEPEGSPEADEGLIWNNQSWGYWKYSFVPTASKLKWLEPRHMVNICNRWARDKTDDLQHAFFNGLGYESWENIWGIWNQITPRDAEALRRISKIERSFSSMLVSPGWEPHTPTLQFGVFAGKFPADDRVLWLFVNRNEYAVNSQQIEVPYQPGVRYLDIWHGEELAPEVHGDRVVLTFDTEAHGYGTVLQVNSESQVSELTPLLSQMKEWAKRPLSTYSHEWTFLPQRMVEIASTKRLHEPPPGMVAIPSGPFNFDVKGIEIEGENWIGLDVQYPGEDSPRRSHYLRMTIKPFYIDKYPVTNAQFKQFLDATGWRPADGHNFLRDWKNGTYPQSWGNRPVTWVSLEDARAYAKWSGKRLPHEWEWQYAAQGTDGRLYPWGNTWDAAAVPVPDTGRELTGPDPVDAHPKGVSSFGVMDMVGNIWQWTDEYVDEHTRAAILRGGSYYHPQGSMWYFPNTYKLNEHGKYLLMAPSKDRAGTLGFRCVVDAE